MPKQSNDINIILSLRRKNGRKLTRREVVQVLLSLINAWEENDDTFLDIIYNRNEPAQIVVGVGDKVVGFGAMFSDVFMSQVNQLIHDSIKESTEQAGARATGGIDQDDESDEPFEDVPENIAAIIRKMIDDAEGRSK